MKVRKIKRTTEAYQWTDGPNELEMFMNVLSSICSATAYLEPAYDGTNMLVLDGVRIQTKNGDYKDFVLSHGSWLMVRSDGKVWSLTDEEYKEKYEEDK